MSDFIAKTVEFNTLAGASGKFDSRKVALYLGLILEEVEESIAAIPGDKLNELRAALTHYSAEFKAGKYDVEVTRISRVEALDGFIDTAVVAVGAAHALGADVAGAANHIADNNLSKFPVGASGARVVLKDANGKVKKPDCYTSPDIAAFLKD